MAKVLLRMTPKNPRAGEEVKLQVIVEHPNESGFRVDEEKQELVPRRTIEELLISMDGKPVLTLKPDIGMSTNPTFTVFMRFFDDSKLQVRFRDQIGETGETAQEVRLNKA
jgi:sulfur-oxidizing protein SoxZ